MNRNHPRGAQRRSHATGFTLLELMVVMVIAGLLLGIGAPAFLSWLNCRRIEAARSEVYSALQLTQREAMQRHETWQFSLRQQGTRVEWAIHPKTINPALVQGWNALNPNVTLDTADTSMTSSKGIYYTYFKYTGDVTLLGTVTFQGRSASRERRCVVVSTMIGAIRQGKNHVKPNGNGRYCY